MTDTADLETLWHEHHTRLYSYILVRLHDHDVTADLVSCVYLRALVAIRNGNGSHSNPAAWLFTIARSVIIDHWRAMQHVTFSDFAELEEEPDTDASPHEQAEAGVIRERVAFAVKHLGESYPQLMTLRMEGYSFAEIADFWGVTVAAAKQRGTRAYSALREPVAGLVEFAGAA